MANISNKDLQKWADEHEPDFAAKVKDIKKWRRLYTIARMYDLETVDDEGVSHGTARDDLPRNSLFVVHDLIDGVLSEKIISQRDIDIEIFASSILCNL